ncbi:MAG TPA: hypothetical protein DGT23_04765, partial [Micromonosporaceae bacterium]|nr:hypothetical protein [Micromonosporaceae bacterium]
MDDVDFRDTVDHWLTREAATLILQPTSLCPLACTYCYLPERHLKQEMSPAIARAVAGAIPSSWPSTGVLEVVWHGGEPLAIGRTRLVEFLEPFEPLRIAGRVQHKVQTGATLITNEWCDLFERYGIGVGVSIDGPRSVNRHRIDRGGRPMFDRIVAGIETLQRRGLPFTVLAVVGQDSTGDAEEILTFLAGLGCTWVGFNVEAREAANVDGETPVMEEVRRFWRDVFAWASRNPGM